MSWPLPVVDLPCSFDFAEYSWLRERAENCLWRICDHNSFWLQRYLVGFIGRCSCTATYQKCWQPLRFGRWKSWWKYFQIYYDFQRQLTIRLSPGFQRGRTSVLKTGFEHATDRALPSVNCSRWKCLYGSTVKKGLACYWASPGQNNESLKRSYPTFFDNAISLLLHWKGRFCLTSLYRCC